MTAYSLGVLLAEQDPPDVTGATAAYHRPIDYGHPEQAPTAMVNLLPLLLVEGDTGRARVLPGEPACAGSHRAPRAHSGQACSGSGGSGTNRIGAPFVCFNGWNSAPHTACTLRVVIE